MLTLKSVSPAYRKDRYSKVFRKALPEKAKLAMMAGGFQIPNSLVLLQQAKKLVLKQKDVDNGITDAQSVASEPHGAEEEVARGNAVMAQTEAKAQTAGDAQQYLPSPEVYAAITLLSKKREKFLASFTTLDPPRRRSLVLLPTCSSSRIS